MAQDSNLNSKIESKTFNIDSIINSCLNEINPDSIVNTIQSLQNFSTRFMLEPNRKDIAVFLKEKFISMGYINTILDSFLTITDFNYAPFYLVDTTWQYNVIATLDGSEYPDSVCIVGGHYDSFSDSILVGKGSGADDDASGIAAIIEIARIFKKVNYYPRLSIKFIAFAAEELTLFSDVSGSSYYANKAYANNEKIKFYANNDMISNQSSANPWKCRFHCFTGMSWMKNFAISMCQNYTSISPVISGDNALGDSHSFWQNGFQTVYFEEYEFSSNYHTVLDIVDSINKDYCAEVAKISMALLINGSQTYSGIDENNNISIQLDVKIYPNPAKDWISITIKKSTILKNTFVSIYNIQGQILLQQQIQKEKTELDVSTISKGLYFIKLSIGEGIVAKKFVKE
jgi:hypothetical protein